MSLNERVQAERARLVGNDRHDILADAFVRAAERAADVHKRRRGGNFRGRAFEKFGEVIQLRHVEFDRLDDARGQKTAQRLAAFEQVLDLRAVRRRTVKRRLGNDVVADGNIEALAEFAQLLLVHFFLLMRDVPAFAGFAQAVALHRLGQNHGRLAFVLHRGLVGGINISRYRDRRAATCGFARRVRWFTNSSSSGYLPKKCLRV